MGEFTHFNEQGHAVMVDVSEKADTMREATAMGRIRMSKECFEKVKTGGMKKGRCPGNCKDCRDHGGEENIRADPVVPYPEPEQGYSGI